MSDFFSESVIERIMQSLAFALGQSSFLATNPLAPGQMLQEKKRKLIAAVSTFFGLEAPATQMLLSKDTYAEWAFVVAQALREQETICVTFHTSGSTGTPRPYVFTIRDIEAELHSLAPHFAGRRRIISVMPVHHVFGFVFALMLPRCLGIPSIHKPPLPTADFFATLESGDLVLAFPIFWKSFLNMNRSDVPPNVHGVSSAAPCPPEIIERLTGETYQRPLLGRMTEIYGATEFGAIGIRTACHGPYTLLDHWDRAPFHLPGTEGGAHWGIRRVYGPAEPLPDDTIWEDERHFMTLRRKDHAVQVGGFNVYPLQVAETLKEFHAVQDCAVRLMRPDEGSRLKAYVVLKRNFSPTPQLVGEMRQWLATRLSPPAIPKSFCFGEGLPYTPSGKAADWNISEHADKHRA